MTFHALNKLTSVAVNLWIGAAVAGFGAVVVTASATSALNSYDPGAAGFWLIVGYGLGGVCGFFLLGGLLASIASLAVRAIFEGMNDLRQAWAAARETPGHTE